MMYCTCTALLEKMWRSAESKIRRWNSLTQFDNIIVTFGLKLISSLTLFGDFLHFQLFKKISYKFVENLSGRIKLRDENKLISAIGYALMYW